MKFCFRITYPALDFQPFKRLAMDQYILLTLTILSTQIFENTLLLRTLSISQSILKVDRYQKQTFGLMKVEYNFTSDYGVVTIKVCKFMKAPSSSCHLKEKIVPSSSDEKSKLSNSLVIIILRFVIKRTIKRAH